MNFIYNGCYIRCFIWILVVSLFGLLWKYVFYYEEVMSMYYYFRVRDFFVIFEIYLLKLIIFFFICYIIEWEILILFKVLRV